MKYYSAIFLDGILLQTSVFDNYEDALGVLVERRFVKTGEEIGFHGLVENFVSTASSQFTGSITHEDSVNGENLRECIVCGKIFNSSNEGEKGSHHCSDECWLDDSEE